MVIVHVQLQHSSEVQIMLGSAHEAWLHACAKKLSFERVQLKLNSRERYLF
jgi:hypothetical protein